ncbi:MAG: Spy/CpxP family protein refolding chaperone [Pyrinomonadaceae bacterium]
MKFDWKKFATLFALVFTFGLVSENAFGQTTQPETTNKDKVQQRGGKKKGMRGDSRQGMRGHNSMFEDLDLTDAQKAQIQKIMQDNREAQKKQSAENKDEMRELMAAKRSGLLTSAQEARLKAIGDERKANMERIHNQIMDVLTAEQKAKFEAKQAEMKAKMQERQKMRQERQEGKSKATKAVKATTSN